MKKQNIKTNNKLDRKSQNKLGKSTKLSKTTRTKNSKKIKKIIVKPIMTDEQIAEKEGHYFTEKDFKQIIKTNCDVYREDEEGKQYLLLSLRKRVIPKDKACAAYTSLQEEAQKKHNNRGAAAGLLDETKLPSYVKKITKKQKFRAYYIGKDGKERKDHISNYVKSGIIGFYDKPDRNAYNPSNINSLSKSKKKQILNNKKERTSTISSVPCRMTKFTKTQVENWNQCLPFIQEADNQFKTLVPDRHQVQLSRARETKDYQIKDTAFSTITINYNYQTALHKDRGDLPQGFGNLLVLEKSKCIPGSHQYSGGYLGFPQYGVAVDVRHGDFLAMDVHQWHTNTKISPKIKGKTDFGRLSIVCYLRKNMIKCKNTK